MSTRLVACFALLQPSELFIEKMLKELNLISIPQKRMYRTEKKNFPLFHAWLETHKNMYVYIFRLRNLFVAGEHCDNDTRLWAQKSFGVTN